MSPAGHWPQLRAAIEAGADACYFGLKHFTARAKVGFELAELPEVMRTLHQRGVRGYLTFNTLVFEHELAEAARAVAAVAEAGVDALIVQDLGVLGLARRIAPDLELHASTQASITSAEGVEFARAQGAHRITLARELSLEEIALIYEKTHADLEIFVHGALCVAYSGQCFSSEAWGGRSANRGQCAQACRLPYDLLVDGIERPLDDARYLLSPGDLSALEIVPQVIDSGVSCLKIEGRYKDADYVALTTRAYRAAVDAAWEGRPSPVTPRTALDLEQVYSRGLGPHFLSGVNHQAVVRGRHARHRGVLLGTVSEVLPDRVQVEPSAAHDLSPLKAGDGVVFDAATWRSPQEKEEGGRLYHVRPSLTGALELTFANGAVDFARIRPGDLLWRTHDPELDQAARPYVEATSPVAKQPVTVSASATPASPLTLIWTLRNGQSVTVTSPAPLSAAQNRGLSADSLRDQLDRLGNTPYALKNLSVNIEGSLFAPASLLNQLRRDAVIQLQALQGQIPSRRPMLPPTNPDREGGDALRPTEPHLHLLVRNAEQLAAALDLRPASITLDYLDLYGLRPSVERVKAAGLTARVASPRILKPGESRIANFLASLACPILVRSTGLLQAAPQAELIGDFSLNTANTLTAEAYLALGLTRLTPTHDLNAAQVAALARAVGAERIEAVVYQHLPVFHTEHCVFCRFLSTGTTHRDCGRPCEAHQIALRDGQGREHPVIADVGCRNTVFGAEAQQASAHLEAWRQAGIHHFRLEFVHEDGEQVRQVTQAFASALSGYTTYSQLTTALRRVTPVTEGSLFVPKDYQLFPILS
ncbi:MAG: U32 family peptidase [Bryobacteraceae bacterium]|nr:U32 family peptidase [Bryobacteraceae bacterium]